LFHAGVLWLLLSGVMFVVREFGRRYRRDPGRCASCGYDLRGNPTETCPECGTTKRDPAGRPSGLRPEA
jgi:hypothetical protein